MNLRFELAGVLKRRLSRPSIRFLKCVALTFLVVLWLAPLRQHALAQQKKSAATNASTEATVTPEEASRLEAVIATDLGVIRFEFRPDKAPRHVQQFIKLARAGFYDGSAFFRVIQRGLIQGGDPLVKDPNIPRERWGSGALNQLPDEFSDLKHLRGTISTVRIPGQPNSGGAQFFICASPQPQLDGQFSAFGQVTEGIDVVDRISLAPADANQLVNAPIKILSLKIEPTKPEPFKDATVDQLRRDVLLRTTFGDITLEMDPSVAPEHVRNFLRLVETGWYDHTAFHRVVPGFVIQGGLGSTRAGGVGHPADRWVRKLKGEFSRVNHIRGVLSMARGDDPNSADTSFFIVTGPAPHLDGKYTIFGKVVDGIEVLNEIEKVARDGERPRQRIELIEAAIKP
ncbi:MAG TPA: peptidylprolyl isomerase [Blastocatellia bacterium]|nr:peptidylprolyl isomerase [Blastocatellia bacterium]